MQRWEPFSIALVRSTQQEEWREPSSNNNDDGRDWTSRGTPIRLAIDNASKIQAVWFKENDYRQRTPARTWWRKREDVIRPSSESELGILHTLTPPMPDLDRCGLLSVLN